MDLNNIVVVSDLHAGCRLGLCPPEGAQLDDGGTYQPSALQLKLYAMWREFWDEFVPSVTKRERYGVVINGDAVEGVHHRATTPISHNIGDQIKIALALLKPIADQCAGRFWMVRGTEAHVGISAQIEEGLAGALNAVPNEEGQRCRWELWKRIGDNRLIHFLHHIGPTGSQAYEATAVHKELIESYVSAAQWGQQPPDMIVRSHRHRYIETTLPTASGRGIAVVTPAWQGKTAFAWRIPGARLSPPQFGGIVIRWAHGQLFAVPKVWTVQRSAAE